MTMSKTHNPEARQALIQAINEHYNTTELNDAASLADDLLSLLVQSGFVVKSTAEMAQLREALTIADDMIQSEWQGAPYADDGSHLIGERARRFFTLTRDFLAD